MVGKILNSFDRKYAFGLLTGLFFGLLGVYTDYFRNNDPSIQFDVLSNTTVIDLKENIGKIDILYDSVSILSKKQTLSLITVKISNIGNADILKNYYDNNFPLGIKIENGAILEKPSLIQASNNYLSKSIGLTLINKSEITFSDFIFEQNEFIVLKLLILHNESLKPEITPKGKIAGVKEIIVKKSYLNKDTKSFWEQVKEGSFLVHTTRSLLYGFLVIIVFVVILTPIAYFSDLISKNKRRRNIRDYKRLTKKDLLPEENFILDFYYSSGIYPLKRLDKTSSDYLKYKYLFKILNSDFDEKGSMMHLGERSYENETKFLIRSLKEKGYLKVENNNLIFSNNLNTFIKEFIRFVETEK